jgi:hypothetical protein
MSSFTSLTWAQPIQARHRSASSSATVSAFGNVANAPGMCPRSWRSSPIKMAQGESVARQL